MKKKKHTFNLLLRRYNKYLRKRKNLILANRNKRRQAILSRHIDRLLERLTTLKLGFQQGTMVAAIALGSFAFQSNEAQAQTFGPLQTNPFSLSTLGDSTIASPAIADLDGDGDYDILTADDGGNGLIYFENTGTASIPSFGALQVNPFSITLGGSFSNPTLVDLDGDNDLDLMVGDEYGGFDYYENTGSTTSPTFGAVQTMPFSLTNIGTYSNASFADLDNDGDLDLMAGDYYANFTYFENTGSSTNPVFGAPQVNPFSLVSLGTDYTVTDLKDFDGDGDYDLMSSEGYGNFYYFENTGTVTSPVFGMPTLNPFGLTNIGAYYASAFLVDMDADGDLDLFSHEYYGDFMYFENTTPVVGIEEELSESNFAIYPNPTNGFFTINIDVSKSNTTVTVVSVDGKTVLNTQAINTTQLTLDASSWSKGVYVVHINNPNSSKTLRLIKR